MSEPVADIEHFYRVTGRMRWQLEVKIRAFENMHKLTTVIAGSATLAMAGTIVAEFIAANAGIGYSIRIALYQSDLGKILVALFLIGIIPFRLSGPAGMAGGGHSQSLGKSIIPRSLPWPRRRLPGMQRRKTMQHHRSSALAWAVVLVVMTVAVILPPPARGAEQLTYRLKWLFNASVVGDLYADAHGDFAAAGLDVTIKAGGPERDAIKELELGQAQFGVASADQVIRALAKGSPVVVIAQLFQDNPLQWIYRKSDPPIVQPGGPAGARPSASLSAATMKPSCAPCWPRTG